MMKKLLLLCLPFAASVAMAQDDPQAKFAGLITPKALREKLTILAGPEMEGRETAMPGQKKAAAYIEDQFKKFGLKPGNGESYQQLYPVYFDAMTDPLLRVNGRTFGWDKEYTFAVNNMYNGTKTFSNSVFVGYGNAADYTGLDVKGRLVIVLDGGAPAATPGQTRGFNPMAAKMMAARNGGAVGMLLISSAFPRTTATPLKSTRMTLQVNDPAFFYATVSDEVASALIGRTARVPFAEWKDVKKGNYVAELQLGAAKKPEELQSSNVIGVLPGTDKADEFVFLTGHYDHLGKRGDVIYYGADDDGSGSVGVMQMAEAFAAAAKKGHKPRRTMIFMTVSGEEKGLLGSEYYAEHPTVDMAKASADLNTDMIGRGDSSRKADTLNYIYVIGHDKLSSELAPINEAANKKYTNIALDYKYDDPNDPNRIYYRSDHYNFARKGVPILFFYDGMLGADYHRPTDTVDKIQFDIMAKRAQLVFHTAWEIANRDNMLKRDIPLTMPAR
ncbi:M28 family peptidase [Sediminibacterium soli]|uniref:M28 family peptidase n=1 Tax=Sediminibacterium soli TaxID=2698829 RepID=UPI001379507A|nr:M28 family peptidase [Sediminibacterium soli]NCI47714.1 M28 family peptidase [Sediminibacterium soli]